MKNKTTGLDDKSARIKEADVIAMPRQTMRRIQFLKSRENQRMATGAALVSLLVMATLVNHLIWKTHTPSEVTALQGRGIASLSGPVQVSYDRAWQEKLAMDLSHSLVNEQARSGVAPSALDQLRFGSLAGQYDLATQAGIVEKIDLGSDSSDNALVIKDVKEFLAANRKAFGFDHLGNPTAQGVPMYNEHGELMGHAVVAVDSQGRLLSYRLVK